MGLISQFRFFRKQVPEGFHGRHFNREVMPEAGMREQLCESVWEEEPAKRPLWATWA